MLYKFKSKAGGDVIMTGPHGDHLLRLMGREPAAQGILLPQDLPLAIAALEAAVAAEERVADDDAQPQRIGLRQRAWPLLEMMKRARVQDQEVVWGV